MSTTVGRSGSNRPCAARTPRVVVTAVLDGREAGLEPLVLAEIGKFEQAARQESGLYFDVQAFSRGKWAIRARDFTSWRRAVGLAAWSGRRDFVIKGAQRRGGPPQTDSREPTAAMLADRLSANMRAFPNALHVVYVLGHGLGYHSLADMRTTDVARAIADASASAGHGLDLLVSQGCLMANLEAVAQLPPCVRLAILSEPTVDYTYSRVTGEGGRQRLATNVPIRWDELAGPLARATTAEEAAAALLAGRPTERSNNLSRIDVNAVHAQLLPALDRVGQAALAEREGRMSRLADDLLDVPIASPGCDFRDTGAFLQRLSTALVTRDTQTAAGAALTALKAGVTPTDFDRAPHGTRWSGLSFQASGYSAQEHVYRYVPPEDKTTYAETPLPTSWKTFIERLRPSTAPTEDSV